MTTEATAITAENAVAAIVARFELDDSEPLGDQLVSTGVLTVVEGQYLDDAD